MQLIFGAFFGVFLFSRVSYSEVPRKTLVGCMASECHASLKAGVSIHGPVKAYGCDICHSIGRETSKKISNHLEIGTQKKSELNTTCLLCHEGLRHSLSEMKAPHQAIDKKGCVSCHDPHHSQLEKLLKYNSTQELCLSCHTAMKSDIHSLAGKILHSPMSTEKSCLNCHSAHGSNISGILKEKEKESCLNCHSKDGVLSNGKHLENIGKKIGDHAFIHKPIQSDPSQKGHSCSQCHQPHGNKERAFLKARYSEKYYSSFEVSDFQLCFNCHKPELASRAQGGDEVTRFRNGSVNLHYLHMQRKSKGQTCRSCHDVHASQSPKLILDWSHRGDVILPLQFKVNSTGGNCTTACHKLKGYDRERGMVNDPNR